MTELILLLIYTIIIGFFYYAIATHDQTIDYSLKRMRRKIEDTKKLRRRYAICQKFYHKKK